MMVHLMQDSLVLKRYTQVVEVGKRLIAACLAGAECSEEELFYSRYLLGIARLHTGDLHGAFNDAFAALSKAEVGQAWSLVAETVAQLAQNGARNHRSLHELAVFCANQALESGVVFTAFPSMPDHVQFTPLGIKAHSHYHLGNHRQAMAAIELALKLKPEFEPLKELRAKIVNDHHHFQADG
jgi:tetratricopeptide (TPR) repeat protein